MAGTGRDRPGPVTPPGAAASWAGRAGGDPGGGEAGAGERPVTPVPSPHRPQTHCSQSHQRCPTPFPVPTPFSVTPAVPLYQYHDTAPGLTSAVPILLPVTPVMSPHCSQSPSNGPVLLAVTAVLSPQ